LGAHRVGFEFGCQLLADERMPKRIRVQYNARGRVCWARSEDVEVAVEMEGSKIGGSRCALLLWDRHAI
jgi:hypothetical protein